MLKKHKVLITFILLSIITFTSATAVYAETKSYPILLKVGDFFILYAYPAPPYLDGNNRLMVPLRSVCQDLIGGKVSFDNKEKLITIAFDGENVQFSIGSKTAKANGKTIEMDTVPVLKDRHTFVPIRLLIDNLGLKSNWNSEYGFVHIVDERVKQSETYNFMYKNHLPHVVGQNPMGIELFRSYIQDAFAPIGAKLTKVKNKQGGEKWHVSAKLKNITGKDIPKGNADCQIQFFIKVSTGQDQGYSYTYQSGQLPAIKKGGIIENAEQAKVFPSGNDTARKERVDFIVMVGKAIK